MSPAAPKKPSAALAGPEKPAKPVPKPVIKKARQGFFKDDPIKTDVIVNEPVESEHHSRQIAMVFSQTVAIAILTGVLIGLAPFVHPFNQYYGLTPEGATIPLVGLVMPNMTNRAVLSWTATSVTEILTIGFGDFVSKLSAQKARFTEDGWTTFVNVLLKQQIGDQFKKSQLVLTTVPSDTAVILKQGPNEEGIYEWKVQVPVIMTYATNNNVTTHEHGMITLTIVRVPPDRYPNGIAIKAWNMG